MIESPDSDPGLPPKAPAGWFPDPHSATGALRYWDGETWTEHTHSYGVAPAGPASSGRQSRGARNVVGIGGIIFTISPFLTWIDVALLGRLDLFQTVNQSGSARIVVWAAVLAGGVAAYAAWFRDGTDAKIAGLTVGLTGAAAAIYVLARLVPVIKSADGFASLAFGGYVAILGALLMVGGALLVKTAQQAGTS